MIIAQTEGALVQACDCIDDAQAQPDPSLAAISAASVEALGDVPVDVELGRQALPTLSL